MIQYHANYVINTKNASSLNHLQNHKAKKKRNPTVVNLIHFQHFNRNIFLYSNTQLKQPLQKLE